MIGGNHLARTLTGFVSPSVRRSSFGVQAQVRVKRCVAVVDPQVLK